MTRDELDNIIKNYHRKARVQAIEYHNDYLRAIEIANLPDPARSERWKEKSEERLYTLKQFLGLCTNSEQK